MAAISKEHRKRFAPDSTGQELLGDFQSLSNEILKCLDRGGLIVGFLNDVCTLLGDFFGCDSIELRLKDSLNCTRAIANICPKTNFHYETVYCGREGDCMFQCCKDDSLDLEKLCRDVVTKRIDPSSPFMTTNGSFWTGDVDSYITYRSELDGMPVVENLVIGGDYKSLAVLPLEVGDKNIGLLLLKGHTRNFFTKGEIEFCESVAETLGVSLVHQQAQAALHERVKELMCLYGIAQIAERPDISLPEIFANIVELLPPGWQYPEITFGRIILDGESYSTPGFQEGWVKQSAEIIVNGERRGVVEVAYSKPMPELDEGPFLKEERNLIEAIAGQIAQIVEHKRAEEDKAKLQDQLRHADRLATIGQLAAGIAHELNEPLGSILGFAQLASKVSGISDGVERDLEKIISASLHGREVIKKLLLFARQVSAEKTKVVLNDIVEEGLYFFEARCAKEGIELVRSLAEGLPEINADQSQLNQVLVNLVVNAIQAMPEGGILTVSTYASKGYIILVVEDTGCGMSDETIEQIFLPFFTTKDVDEGTGLGLAVVHGIVTSHGGTIDITSKLGEGSKFEVHFPVSGDSEDEVIG